LIDHSFVLSGSISLEELRELLLDDSVLISKKTEANASMVRGKSKSSLDLFQKLVAKEIIFEDVVEALKNDDDDDDAGLSPPTRGAKVDLESGQMASSAKSIDVKSFGNESPSPGSAALSSKKYFSSAAKISPSDEDKQSKEDKDSLV
jgi:hypothetical protein